MLTQQQAYLICEAHEIFSLLDNDEETGLLEIHNPEMLEAYYALHRVAVGADTAAKGRIVCAAIRYRDGTVVCSPRHFDMRMHEIVRKLGKRDEQNPEQPEQGFVDQVGEFLTRKQALEIAKDSGQIIRRVGGDDKRLFSENLY